MGTYTYTLITNDPTKKLEISVNILLKNWLTKELLTKQEYNNLIDQAIVISLGLMDYQRSAKKVTLTELSCSLSGVFSTILQAIYIIRYTGAFPVRKVMFRIALTL